MKMSQLTDSDLIRLYLQGKESAFETLLNRHQSKVYMSIYIMVKDQDLANDIFQDTFIKVVNTLKAEKYYDDGRFLPWVVRIAKNLTIDHFRKEKRMPKANQKAELDIFSVIQNQDLNTEEQLVENQIHEDVKKLIDYLPDDQRDVVIMRHFKNMSFKDIAEQTGVSINTALGRMRYALINLRKIVKENGVILSLK